MASNHSQPKTTPVDLHKIQRYQSFGSLFIMIVIYCLGFIYYGHSTTYLGTFEFKTIVNIFKIDMDQNLAYGLLSGCVYFGGGCGALLGLIFIQNISRRQCLLVTTIVAFIANILILIPHFALLFICRFCQGVCSGLYSTFIPLIIKQILPIETSGTFGAFSALFITLGITLTYLMQFIMISVIGSYEGEYEAYWRILFSFSFPFIIAKFLLLIFVYDFQTPKYLLQQDREEDCIKLLQKIYKEEYVWQVLRQKKIDLGILDESVNTNSAVALQKIEETEHPQNPEGQKKDPQKQAEENSQKRKKKQNISQINSSQYHQQQQPRHKVCLRRFIALNLIFVKQFVGTSVMTPYGAYITSLILPQLTTLIPVLLFTTNAIALVFVSILLSRFGRKPLLQIGSLITIIALIMVTVGFFLNSDEGNILVVVGLFIWMTSTGLSIFSIITLYIAEIVEPTFIMIPTMLNWFLAMGINIVFPILQNEITAGPIFAFFAVYCSIFLVINQKLVIQTKNKTQTQIFTEYDQKL